MHQYTTGEIAQQCGVSVRAVQYYDSRGILVPHELSTGGRRLYDDNDVKTLTIITFLRKLGFSINSIKEMLEDQQSGKVVNALIEEQETRTLQELHDAQERMQGLVALRKTLHEITDVDEFDTHAIADAQFIVKNRKQLRKIHSIMIGLGLIIDGIEIATLIYAINTHNWWPFGLGMLVVIALAIWISYYYFKNTAYLCPNCHTVFQPKLSQAFFAAHTPTARKLRCPHCSYKGYCIEVAHSKLDSKCV